MRRDYPALSGYSAPQVLGAIATGYDAPGSSGDVSTGIVTKGDEHGSDTHTNAGADTGDAHGHTCHEGRTNDLGRLVA
jgi:hypothetical protein